MKDVTDMTGWKFEAGIRPEASDSINGFNLSFRLFKIKHHLRAALLYKLPTVKFRDHLRDSFGWATEPRKSGFDKFFDAFMAELGKMYPNLKLR